MQNKSMSHKTLLTTVLAILVGGGVPQCFALQEEIDMQEETSRSNGEAREKSSEQSTASESNEEQSESEPATRFTPTEKIRAADTISLPVDI